MNSCYGKSLCHCRRITPFIFVQDGRKKPIFNVTKSSSMQTLEICKQFNTDLCSFYSALHTQNNYSSTSRYFDYVDTIHYWRRIVRKFISILTRILHNFGPIYRRYTSFFNEVDLNMPRDNKYFLLFTNTLKSNHQLIFNYFSLGNSLIEINAKFCRYQGGNVLIK